VPGTPPFAPEPGRGRVFEGSRLVRATDATVTGRLRLDGLARFLRDVAEDAGGGTRYASARFSPH
jgi:hypothetical protein